MCGVPSMAAASACAGSTLSSNTTLAFLVFQSTDTDCTPFTRLSEPCTVLVHGGQCRPVTRNVAFVGSAANSDFATASTTLNTATSPIIGIRIAISPAKYEGKPAPGTLPGAGKLTITRHRLRTHREPSSQRRGSYC